jgi:tetratricopeptide (TPR) repeat protein
MGNQGALLVNSRLILIKIYRQQRKFGEAADEFDDIIKTLQPSSASLRMEYAEYLLGLAQVALRISPDNRDPFAQDVRIVRPLERLDALLKDSRSILPEQWMWSLYEGRALALTGKTREAQQKYAQAFNDSKGNLQAASFYLDSLLSSANYQDVVDVTSKLIASQPQYGDFYIKRGMGYAGLKNLKAAAADFHSALDLASKDGLLFLNVARQAISTLSAPLVIAELQARLSAQPADAPANLALADAYITYGKDSEAIKLLTPLIGDKDQAHRAQILRMLALAKQRAKDFEGASKDYLELLKITPDDLEALNNYSFMLAEDLHQPEQALKYAERAIKVLRGGNIDVAFVNNGNVYDTYGWIKFLAGDAPGAIIELRRAIQIEPLPDAYVHLAKALAKDGQSQEAYKVLQDAVANARKNRSPSLPQLEAALKDLH